MDQNVNAICDHVLLFHIFTAVYCFLNLAFVIKNTLTAQANRFMQANVFTFNHKLCAKTPIYLQCISVAMHVVEIWTNTHTCPMQ